MRSHYVQIVTLISRCINYYTSYITVSLPWQYDIVVLLRSHEVIIRQFAYVKNVRCQTMLCRCKRLLRAEALCLTVLELVSLEENIEEIRHPGGL